MGNINIRSKWNLAVFVSYSFFLFVSPFLIFYFEVELERKSQLQNERMKRREEKRKEGKKKEERRKAEGEEEKGKNQEEEKIKTEKA